MKHREKLRQARKHMTPKEVRDKVPPFSSSWWLSRKNKIAKKVKRLTEGKKA